MYGTNISVEFDSVWAKNLYRDVLGINIQEAEIAATYAQAEDGGDDSDTENEDEQHTDE